MLLGGLWHGASWNFVIWGGFHGIALAAQKFWRNLLHKPKTATSKGIRYLLHFAPDSWQNACCRGVIKSSDIQPFIYFQF
eukprot:9812788-Prorocentrum_lima.AAC.1